MKHIQKQHDEGVSKHPKAKARIEMLTKEMEKEGFASIALELACLTIDAFETP
jgi:hypothetical protein